MHRSDTDISAAVPNASRYTYIRISVTDCNVIDRYKKVILVNIKLVYMTVPSLE